MFPVKGAFRQHVGGWSRSPRAGQRAWPLLALVIRVRLCCTAWLPVRLAAGVQTGARPGAALHRGSTIQIIRLIQDIFSDEEELDNFLKHIENNNDKEKADNLKESLYKLLNY